MTRTDTVDRIKLKVCSDCIAEEYLSQHVRKSGIQDQCDFCDQASFAISIDDISILVEYAIAEHFNRTLDQPEGAEMWLAKEGMWERRGEPIKDIIVDYANVSDDIAEKILIAIQDRTWDKEAAEMGEENPFDDEAHYEEKGPDDWELMSNWGNFENSIKTESRYFNRQAEIFLDEIFQHVQIFVPFGSSNISTLAA